MTRTNFHCPKVGMTIYIALEQGSFTRKNCYYFAVKQIKPAKKTCQGKLARRSAWGIILEIFNTRILEMHMHEFQYFRSKRKALIRV